MILFGLDADYLGRLIEDVYSSRKYLEEVISKYKAPQEEVIAEDIISSTVFDCPVISLYEQKYQANFAKYMLKEDDRDYYMQLTQSSETIKRPVVREDLYPDKRMLLMGQAEDYNKKMIKFFKASTDIAIKQELVRQRVALVLKATSRYESKLVPKPVLDDGILYIYADVVACETTGYYSGNYVTEESIDRIMEVIYNA